MAGALKTFLDALQTSSYLTGVPVLYGEDELHDTSLNPPVVVIVPRGGPVDAEPGYASGLDPVVERVWAIRESIDIYLWGYSTAVDAQPIDHVDETEALRQRVLTALQDQRASYDINGDPVKGLWFKVISQRWETPEGIFLEYGRALVLTIMLEITETTSIPAYTTVTSEDLTTTIIAGP